MANASCIGIFDSGLGGLTALTQALRQFPHENFLYFADNLHVPYGDKSPEQVLALTLAAVEQMAAPGHERGLKALVLACNTATSAAAARLREVCPFPVLGMEPAIKPALRHVQDSDLRVLMLSTRLTSQGGKLGKLLQAVDPEGKVDSLPLPELVELAENLVFTGPRVRDLLLAKLGAYDLERYGAMVLGCTHFIWYREALARALPAHLRLFDGNSGTLDHLGHVLTEDDARAEPGQGRKVILRFSGPVGPAKARFLSEIIDEPFALESADGGN